MKIFGRANFESVKIFPWHNLYISLLNFIVKIDIIRIRILNLSAYYQQIENKFRESATSVLYMLPCLILKSYLLSINTSIKICKYESAMMHPIYQKTFHHFPRFLYSKRRSRHVPLTTSFIKFLLLRKLNQFLYSKGMFTSSARAIRCCLSITTFKSSLLFYLLNNIQTI